MQEARAMPVGNLPKIIGLLQGNSFALIREEPKSKAGLLLLVVCSLDLKSV